MVLLIYSQLDIGDLGRKQNTSKNARKTTTDHSNPDFSWLINEPVDNADARLGVPRMWLKRDEVVLRLRAD